METATDKGVRMSTKSNPRDSEIDKLNIDHYYKSGMKSIAHQIGERGMKRVDLKILAIAYISLCISGMSITDNIERIIIEAYTIVDRTYPQNREIRNVLIHCYLIRKVKGYCDL